MSVLSSLLEVVGIAAVVAAVYVLAGFGWGLLAAGVALVVVGVLLDPPRRLVRRDG